MDVESGQQIKDDGGFQKYFHILPNMCDDDLDPFEYRLLGHYKRVCGQHGLCNEAIETTAVKCRMSLAKARTTRRALKKLGYIDFDEKTNGRSVIVTVIDRMKENVARYTPTKNDRAIKSDTPTKNDRATPIENDRSGLSDSIPKEEPSKKNLKEPDSSSQRAADAAVASAATPATDTLASKNPESSPTECSPAPGKLADYLPDVMVESDWTACGISATLADMAAKARADHEAGRVAKLPSTPKAKKERKPRAPQPRDAVSDAIARGAYSLKKGTRFTSTQAAVVIENEFDGTKPTPEQYAALAAELDAAYADWPLTNSTLSKPAKAESVWSMLVAYRLKKAGKCNGSTVLDSKSEYTQCPADYFGRRA